MRNKRNIVSFLRNQRGIAAMELAIMAPILLALLLGGVEISRFLDINAKSDMVCTTLGDFVAREKATTLTNAEITNLFSAAALVMNPYGFGTNGLVIISSVTQTGAPSGSNPPKVSWQRTGGGSYAGSSRIGTPGGNASMPVGFAMAAGDNVIVSEVFYNYTTLFGTHVISNVVLYKVSYYRPRLGSLSASPT
jgi:TadE-like protein